MHLFLIISVPLAYIYLLVLRDQTGQSSALTAIPALKGALAYLIVAVVLLFIERFVERPFSGSGVYFYNAVYDFIVPVYLGFLTYLWFVPNARGDSPEERFLTLASFLAGLFTLAGVTDLFLRADYHGAYELFHLPALRIGLVVLIPTLYYHFSAETYWIRFLHLLLIAAIPFVFGGVPMLVFLNYAAAAIAASVVLFLVSWTAALLWVGGVRSLRLR